MYLTHWIEKMRFIWDILIISWTTHCSGLWSIIYQPASPPIYPYLFVYLGLLYTRIYAHSQRAMILNLFICFRKKYNKGLQITREEYLHKITHYCGPAVQETEILVRRANLASKVPLINNKLKQRRWHQNTYRNKIQAISINIAILTPKCLLFSGFFFKNHITQ